MEKERRTKVLVLSTLVVVVATLSIAFAAMSRTLSINGIGKMDTASWSVYFDNLSNAKITRGAQEIGKPSISTDKGTVQDINVKLSNPKDEISYTVDIVNDGTIDAEITMIKDIELTDAQKKVFEFKVTYTDTGEILQNGDILPKDTTKNITINIKFKDDITEFDLPTEAQTINLSYQITYTQYDGSEIVIEPDGGDINTGKAVLAKGITYEEFWDSDQIDETLFFNGPLPRNQVESINFVNNTNVPDNSQTTIWDASENKDNSIIGWYQDIDSNGLNEVYIGSNANIYAPSDSSVLFSCFPELKEINFNNFNTSEVTNMMEMFAEAYNLINVDFSSFNTEKATDMNCMFAACVSLISLDLSNFNTEKVTNMMYMFSGCENLTSLNLGSFNTSNVITMERMFESCYSLTSLDVSSFNTSNVTEIQNMFNGCEKLTNLDLSHFDISKITEMGGVFSGCSSLANLDLSTWKTQNVTRMKELFDGCSSLVTLKMNSAVFSNGVNTANMFDQVPNNFTIYVKDETAKTFITGLRSDANVIIEPLSS